MTAKRSQLKNNGVTVTSFDFPNSKNAGHAASIPDQDIPYQLRSESQ